MAALNYVCPSHAHNSSTALATLPGSLCTFSARFSPFRSHKYYHCWSPVFRKPRSSSRLRYPCLVRASSETLDLTEENVEKVLLEARSELLQLFDTSVGITGVAELADLDGPFLKLRLSGRFWHQRSIVLARLAYFLQKRIPDILEVEIEDEAQLDDSSANF